MRVTNAMKTNSSTFMTGTIQTEGNGAKILVNTDTKTRTVQFSVMRAKVTLFCGSGTAQTPKYRSFVFLIIADLGVFVAYKEKRIHGPITSGWAAAKIFSYSF